MMVIHVWRTLVTFAAISPATMATRLSNFARKGSTIFGVALNYSDLAATSGVTPPTTPMVFIKPWTAYLTKGGTIKVPTGCKKFFHEVELGVVVGKQGFKIPESRAMEHVGGYALSLDMSAMDIIGEARDKGHPWCIGKGFDSSCPVGDFIHKDQIPDPHNVGLWLKVNNELKQNGNTKNMISDIPTIISYISEYFTLNEGDLLLTGSPAGVGPVSPDDVINCGLADISEMTFHIEA
ncbi:oxaloacetate tautomerase FAHD1, mitochondrial-like [Ptychodera flava]|uniref:oxaloacetate tautomerase FAHD1, mitochondrial-like n=1 Tax=Ptychodera flava TaxID=63121 RepID=UPI003969FBEA